CTATCRAFPCASTGPWFCGWGGGFCAGGGFWAGGGEVLLPELPEGELPPVPLLPPPPPHATSRHATHAQSASRPGAVSSVEASIGGIVAEPTLRCLFFASEAATLKTRPTRRFARPAGYPLAR